jgi:hypothetical protein
MFPRVTKAGGTLLWLEGGLGQVAFKVRKVFSRVTPSYHAEESRLNKTENGVPRELED